jgi:hypothetical protein
MGVVGGARPWTVWRLDPDDGDWAERLPGEGDRLSGLDLSGMRRAELDLALEFLSSGGIDGLLR